MVRRRRPPKRRWPWLAVPAVLGVGVAYILAPTPDPPLEPSLGRQVTIAPSVDPLPSWSPSAEQDPDDDGDRRRPRADASPSPKEVKSSRPTRDAASPTKPAPSAKPSKTSAKPTPTSSKPSKTTPPPPKTSAPATRPATPSPRPTPSTSTPTTPPSTTAPAAPQGGYSGPSTYTSATAVAAAGRMAAAQIVGDPACSLSASGVPNMALVPAGVTSVGVGTVGNYTCLIW